MRAERKLQSKDQLKLAEQRRSWQTVLSNHLSTAARNGVAACSIMEAWPPYTPATRSSASVGFDDADGEHKDDDDDEVGHQDAERELDSDDGVAIRPLQEGKDLV